MNASEKWDRRTSLRFLYDCVRSMLNHSGFNDDERVKFWAECANLETVLDNAYIREDKNQSMKDIMA